MSPPENPQQRDTVAQHLRRLSSPGGPLHPSGPRATSHLYQDAPTGRHADIIDRYTARQPDIRTDGFAAVVMAGPPGAGKSTARAKRNTEGWRILDADIIKTYLIELALTDGLYDDLLTLPLPDGRTVMPAELAPLVHEESTIILDTLRTTCLREGENVLIDGTLTWRPHNGPGIGTLLMNELAAAAYEHVEILDVEVPKTTALERALARWWKDRRTGGEDGYGGRYIPPEAIEAVYLPDGTTKSRLNADEAFSCASSREISHLVLTVFDENAGIINQRTKATGRSKNPPSAATPRNPAPIHLAPGPPVSDADRVWVSPHMRHGHPVDGHWRNLPNR